MTSVKLYNKKAIFYCEKIALTQSLTAFSYAHTTFASYEPPIHPLHDVPHHIQYNCISVCCKFVTEFPANENKMFAAQKFSVDSMHSLQDHSSCSPFSANIRVYRVCVISFNLSERRHKHHHPAHNACMHTVETERATKRATNENSKFLHLMLVNIA